MAVLVLFTVAAGASLASRGLPDWPFCAHLFGTALVAAGASALNQLLERHTDALMRRTENRPLPAGRLAAPGSLVFGLVLGVAGLVYLAVMLASTAGRPGGRLHFAQLRLSVHAAQAKDLAQHPGGRRPRGPAAGDRLDGRQRLDRTAKCWSCF